MTDTTNVPQDEPQGEAASTAEELAGQQTAPEAEPEGTPEPEQKGEDEKGKTPWFMKTITDLRASRRELDAQLAAERQQKEFALNELALLKAAQQAEPQPAAQPSAPPKTASPTLSQDDVERLALQKAQELAAAQRFNEACNNAYSAGKSEFTDFDEAIRNLGMVGAVGQNANPTFLEMVTEIPNSHKVLHHLGNNLDDAARILQLPPAKMALEMARIEATLSKPQPKPISSAPAPIRPVEGKGKAEYRLEDPNIPMDKWVELRRKQREARK